MPCFGDGETVGFSLMCLIRGHILALNVFSGFPAVVYIIDFTIVGIPPAAANNVAVRTSLNGGWATEQASVGLIGHYLLRGHSTSLSSNSPDAAVTVDSPSSEPGELLAHVTAREAAVGRLNLFNLRNLWMTADTPKAPRLACAWTVHRTAQAGPSQSIHNITGNLLSCQEPF
jgi:hypothetical protein